MKKIVIFDLDGTLLNSVADLAQATNYALSLNGYPTHPEEAYRFFVGNGINKLFERALPEGAKTEENVLRIRETFIPYYNEHKSDLTRPYAGVVDLLESLQDKGLTLAIASNKYMAATVQLVSHFFPSIHFDVVLGQRDDVPVKPHPQIVHDILQHTGYSPADVLYVGDTAVDMHTAHNAGVDVVAVTWGFRPRAELEACHPTHIVDHPLQILSLIE
ncbi:MAG: HAD family hydrolase [Paludibacteraceae bacterium]|nr:HAD family hydrolase [Paludibacteraceae bacterium]